MQSQAEITYTLPAADHASAGQLGITVRRVVDEEFVELRDELLKLTEDEERPVLGPSWACGRVAGLASQDDARVKNGLAWQSSTKSGHEWLRNTVQEAEI